MPDEDKVFGGSSVLDKMMTPRAYQAAILTTHHLYLKSQKHGKIHQA